MCVLFAPAELVRRSKGMDVSASEILVLLTVWNGNRWVWVWSYPLSKITTVESNELYQNNLVHLKGPEKIENEVARSKTQRHRY